MKAKPAEVGRVVISLQGRDAGRWFAVTQVVDEWCVLLCDGDVRKLAKPKKKQLKHLMALPLTVPVTGKGASGGAISDSDIRKSLKAARDAYETATNGARDGASQMKEECAFVQRGCH